MLPILSKSLVMIWYKANQTYIAQYLCVNKNNSDLPDCKGCCVLNEQLKKVDDNKPVQAATNTENRNKQTSELDWLFCFKNKLTENKKSSILLFLNQNPLVCYLDQYLAKINKPPC